MNDFKAAPRVTTDGDHIKFVSRIHFRMSPASKELAQRLLDRHAKHTYKSSTSRSQMEVWPLSTEFAVMELTDRAPRAEYAATRLAHEMMAEAQGAQLEMIEGFAEIVSQERFDETDSVS